MIYLVSYPKSGRTYLRYMIGKYFQLKHNLEEHDLLDYSMYGKAYNCKHGITFTHSEFYEDYYKTTFEQLQLNKTIWLKRNPYDTLVSFYFHVKYRKKQTCLNLSEFIRSIRYGIVPFIVFKTQCEMLDNILTINYEELVETPDLFLYAILKSMGEEPILEYLDKAVKLSSFNYMRQAEVSGSVNISEKSYIDKNDIRQLKTRSGKVNNYRSYLNSEDVNYIDEELHNYNKWEQDISDRVNKLLRVS